MNWRRSSTTLVHCPSSATSPSLLGIFLNTCSTHHSHVRWHLLVLLRTALLQNEVHTVSPSLPALGPPSQWHSSVVELIHRAGHWNTSSWQAAPAVSLICLLCNKSTGSIVIYTSDYILSLGFSFVTPAHELLRMSRLALALKRLPTSALQPTINRDQGFDLPAIYSEILPDSVTRDRSRQTSGHPAQAIGAVASSSLTSSKAWFYKQILLKGNNFSTMIGKYFVTNVEGLFLNRVIWSHIKRTTNIIIMGNNYFRAMVHVYVRL